MINNDFPNLGANIKGLRKACGESQLDLTYIEPRNERSGRR